MAVILCACGAQASHVYAGGASCRECLAAESASLLSAGSRSQWEYEAAASAGLTLKQYEARTLARGYA